MVRVPGVYMANVALIIRLLLMFLEEFTGLLQWSIRVLSVLYRCLRWFLLNRHTLTLLTAGRQ